MESNQHQIDTPEEHDLETLAYLDQPEIHFTDTAETNTRSTAIGIDMLQKITDLQEEVQGLREDFDTKLKYDTSKEHLIDTLHQELQVYREGQHYKYLRPLFMDLIDMYDDMGKLLEITPANPLPEVHQALQNLLSFQDSIEEILSRNGVEAFQTEEPFFIAGKQRITKVVNTQDPAQDRQIYRRVRKGFAYDERILRLELVEAYKFTEDNA